MWVEGPLVFGHGAFNGDCPVDVTDLDQLVIAEILAQAVVGPTVHQLLPCDLIKVLVRVVDDEWNLDVLRDIPSFFNFGVAVLQDSGL